MISIVIPVYNREKTIGYCLDSILGQRNPVPYEIIIVNDGSTDRSLAVIEDRLVRSSVPVSVVSQKNAGVSAARNAGKALAKGDYIWFVDSDDVLPQGALRYLGLALNVCPVDIVNFKARRMSEVPSEFVLEDCLPGEACPDLVLSLSRLEDASKISNLSIIGWNALYRRTLIETIQFQPFTHGEDTLFGIEALVHAREIAFFDVVLYGYVIGHSSATLVMDERAFLSVVDVMKHRMVVVESSGIPIDVKRVFVKKICNEFIQKVAIYFDRKRISRKGWRIYFKAYYRMVVCSSYSGPAHRLVAFLIWLPHSPHLIYFVYHCFRVRGWIKAKYKRLLARCAFLDRNKVPPAEEGLR